MRSDLASRGGELKSYETRADSWFKHAQPESRIFEAGIKPVIVRFYVSTGSTRQVRASVRLVPQGETYVDVISRVDQNLLGQTDGEVNSSSCKRNATNYSSCLKHAMENSWSVFMAGKPEYNFLPLNPFFLDYHRHEYNGSVIQGSIAVINSTLLGLEKARFTSVKPYFKKDIFRLELDMRVPEMIYEGDSKIEGNLIGFKLSDKGHFKITIGDVRIRWITTGHMANDRWIIEYVFINPTVETMKIHLDNFYEGSKELDELAMDFVNNNWQILYQTMIPVASQVWNTRLTDYCNRFFSKVFFTKVFP
ncbi:hypothetical protein DMN91_000949 [Ooceraea biroi]|uniref:Circadian clock-controlled protein n=1 Tax=Ooceraea biroi TaxID=2015173 RepID=A0A3L8E336_OOCBI|nr:hypothetical protein DMN91_000949 [Ooceraea biroi]